MIEAKRIDDDILLASLREMSNYPMQFEVDRVVYMLIRMHKIKELVRLLCVRFLFIQEYQEQENSFASTRDRVIKIDGSYYKTQENVCMTPILMILDIIYDTYVEKVKVGGTSMSMISSFFDYSKEVSMFDYLKDEYLKNLSTTDLVSLKTQLVEIILIHDSRKLHDLTLNWLKSKELYEDLEKVTSQYYDKFIKKLEKEKVLNVNEITLVYKYLVKTQEYRRVIKFLVPIIDTDTSQESSCVKEDLTINHRIHYTDIALKACEAEKHNVNTRQETESIIKALNQYKESLLIQSTIEDVLIKLSKAAKNPNEKKETAKTIANLNSRVFDYDSLITNFTEPEKLYCITLTILKSIAVEKGKPTEEEQKKVYDCYCHIMMYYAHERRSAYPRVLYESLEGLAKEYYVDTLVSNNHKIPVKK